MTPPFAPQAEEYSSEDAPLRPPAGSGHVKFGPRVDLDRQFAPVPRQEHEALKKRVELLESQITGLLAWQSIAAPETYRMAPAEMPAGLAFTADERKAILEGAKADLAADVRAHRAEKVRLEEERRKVFQAKVWDLEWEAFRWRSLLAESREQHFAPDVVDVFAKNLHLAETELNAVKPRAVRIEQVSEWRIPDDTIAEIWRRLEADPQLVGRLFCEFVAPDISWKEGSHRAWGECPYCHHPDRKFNVNLETTQFNCYNANRCGRSGNLRTALKEWTTGMSFRELMKLLGERVGIIIEDPKPKRLFDV